jgi:integrase
MRAGLSLLEVQAAQDRLRRGEPAFPEDVPQDKPKTIGDILESFWAWRQERGLKSVEDDKRRWKLLASLEPKTLAAIGDDELAELVKGMQKSGLKPASIALALNLLSSLYKFARVPNPVKGYKTTHRKILKSKHDPKKTPFLADHAKSHALAKELAGIAPVYGIAYSLSRWAGLRPGEVRALRWENVDLKRGRVSVSESVRLNKLDTTKSDKPRLVPIGPELVAALKAWREINPSADLVCPALPPHPKARAHSIYLNEKGLAEALETVLARLELPAMTFYEVGRHSFASDWAIQGRSIYQLKELMGHVSVSTTERYAHLGEDNIKPL